jgi:hypothetical protein
MILAMPAIGVLKILLSHSEHLKPFVILLEDKDRNSSKNEDDDEIIEKPKLDITEKVEARIDNLP